MKQLFILLLLACRCMATTWYVDNSLSTGSNTGTSWPNAWRTLGGITGVSAGDTIQISGGTTSSSQTYDVNQWSPTGGSSTAPITYEVGQDSSHNGTVVLDAQTNSAGINPQSYTVFNGNNGTATQQVTGALQTNCSIVLKNAGDRAIYLTSNNVHDVTFQYIYVDTSNIGILFCENGTNDYHVFINNCYFHKAYNLVSGNNQVDDTLYFGGLKSSTGFGSNGAIHHNTFQYPIGTTSTDPAYGDDVIKWGDGLDVYNNHFVSYSAAGYPSTGQHSDAMQVGGNYWRVYSNSFENPGESVMYHDEFGGPPVSDHDVYFYNNVCWLDSTFTPSGVCRGLDWQPESGSQGGTYTNFWVENNLFANFTQIFSIRMNNAGGTWTTSGVVNNLFVNDSGGPLTQDATVEVFYNKADAASGGTSSIGNTSGPGNTTAVTYVSPSTYDFHLAATDAGAEGQGSNFPGTTPPNTFSTDHDGVTRPTNWALGPYERVDTVYNFLVAPTSGTFSQGGTWSFGAATGSNWYTDLNGSTAGGGYAVLMLSINEEGGTIDVMNASHQWYAWNGTGWTSITGPTSFAGTTFLAAPATGGSITVGSDTWSFGTSGTGGYQTLKNGSQVGGGYGIVMINEGGTVYVFDNNVFWWWQWTGSAWSHVSAPAYP